MLWTASECIKGYVRTTDSFEFFVDGDHAGERKLGTRSRTALIFFFNGVPIFWVSKKQPVTALSSAESEIYALLEACKQAKLLTWRAQELGIKTPSPIVIQMDNKAGISFQKSTCVNTKLGGTFDLRDKRLRELKDKNQISTVHVPTDKNPADLLTKCHPVHRFVKLMQLIKSKNAC